MKMLPEVFTRDADSVARFEREAKLFASLNHANIAALYGMEESGGQDFLVMELVEGQTLAARTARGPLPVEEALKIAHQITEAFEAAHDVIHRDFEARECDDHSGGQSQSPRLRPRQSARS